MKPIKWTGTTLCIIGIALTSFNIYPANIFLMSVGTAIWLFVGVRSDDWALATGELVSLVLYLIGIGAVAYTFFF